MVDVGERLRGLADHPPTPPTPVATIAARGRSRHRHALLLRSGTGVVAAALVATAAVYTIERRPVHPTRPTGHSDVTATSDGASVRVDPGRELADGEIVAVTGHGFPPTTQLSLAMCEPGTTLTSAAGTCDVTTIGSVMTSASGAFATRFRVHAPSVGGDAARRCQTVSYCALAVAESSLQRGPLVVTRLHFAPPGTRNPSTDRLGALSLTPAGPLDDRSTVTLTGTGLVPDSRITLALCDGHAEQASCGGLGALDVPVGRDGTFVRSLSIYRQLFTGDGFVDCGDPNRTCYLRGLLSSAGLFIDRPVHFDPSQPAPPLPSFTITGTEPTSDGVRATIRGADLPSDEPLGVAQCALGTDGVPDRATCITPTAAFTTADRDGSFMITASYTRNYLAGPEPVDCTIQTCVLASFRGEGDSQPIATTPIDLARRT